jgi:hypothetical protein
MSEEPNFLCHGLNNFIDTAAIVTYTVIRFLQVSAKFGTCTVVSINGTLVGDKMHRFDGECAHFSFNSVSFTLTTVQVTNLALTRTKRITVYSLKGLGDQMD